MSVKNDYGWSFLDYSAIISATPLTWLKFEPELCGNPTYLAALKTKKLASKVYKFLQRTNTVITATFQKWSDRIPKMPSFNVYSRQFYLIFQLTNVPKLCSFQFRLLHGAIILNSHLYRWKLRSDNLCSFCNEEKETIQHLLCDCPISRELWSHLSNFIAGTFCQNNPDLCIDTESIIFNSISKVSNANICNFLCLVTKQFIYHQRCLDKLPIFADLKSHIYQIQNVEKYIAKKNDNLSVYMKKWDHKEMPSPIQPSATDFIDAYFM